MSQREQSSKPISMVMNRLDNAVSNAAEYINIEDCYLKSHIIYLQKK